MNADDYAGQLKQLLPRGVLWQLEDDSEISATLLGTSDELARVDARAKDVLEEADPRTADETIADWERVLGLPDEQVPVIPATLAGRRIAVTQKYVARSSQSTAYYIALAAACGYTITIVRFNTLGGTQLDEFGNVLQLLACGFRVGDRVYGRAYAYSMRVYVSDSETGALSHADFERVIRHNGQSYVSVGFIYL